MLNNVMAREWLLALNAVLVVFNICLLMFTRWHLHATSENLAHIQRLLPELRSLNERIKFWAEN